MVPSWCRRYPSLVNIVLGTTVTPALQVERERNNGLSLASNSVHHTGRIGGNVIPSAEQPKPMLSMEGRGGGFSCIQSNIY
jgi:hypothetical protein